ncbi:MAG: V-type ATP synthase subunit E family protein [Clostridia bacterium]
MTGSEAIVNKIIGDARKVVNSTLEEANASAQDTLDLARNDEKIYLKKNMQESYAERDETVRRRITVANLEVKKIILKSKQDLIDKAFQQAIEEVKADSKVYKDYIASLLTFAQDGDEVIIAESDKKLITKAFIGEIAKSIDKKISVAKEYGNFCGGIVLSAKGTDKNLSLEVELSSVRDEFEPKIAKIMFGA